MPLKRRQAVALTALVLFAVTAANAQAPIPTRTPLATFAIAPAKPVARIEATRVDFQPGQIMPLHMHPVPVICFVSKGEFRVKIGDEPERAAPPGSATYEAPGVRVHYFRNASTTQSAQLLCAVLAGAEDKVTSVMLGDGR